MATRHNDSEKNAPKPLARRRYPKTGGTWSRDKDSGELKPIEPPTADHPEGNRPRDRRGNPLSA